jgi:hypothetical protein
MKRRRRTTLLKLESVRPAFNGKSVVHFGTLGMGTNLGGGGEPGDGVTYVQGSGIVSPRA